MSLNEGSLLKPFRQMAGQPAPGADLGGWYNYDPNYDRHKDDAGFAPSATFGQWISALARYYAITRSKDTRDKVVRLDRFYAKTISEDFYDRDRFPAYCFDMLGLIDSSRYVSDPDAFAILDRTTKAAVPHLPGKAVDPRLGSSGEGPASTPGTSLIRFQKPCFLHTSAVPEINTES